MYPQLPEFVRRSPKAYWFITVPQAGAGIGGAMLFIFVGLPLLAPVGAILGIVAFTKRQGVFNYEKVLALARWLRLQTQEEDVADQADLYRATTPPVRSTMLLRHPGRPTVAIQPERKR
ncbi:MAG: hypothetical protein PVF45_00240 [Anaerolineae bacterium]|jgi:hypothetical protein